MHNWGDPDVDWKGISDAAHWIGGTLRRWGRMNVTDMKEKWGTVRVYCNFGWYQMHSITHPGYSYSQYPQWLWSLDCLYLSRCMWLFNWLIIPYQKWLYVRVYTAAVQKWPHLAREIVSAADYRELLE